MDMDEKPPTFQDYGTRTPAPQPPQQQQQQPPQQQSLYGVSPSNCYHPLQAATSTPGHEHDFTRGTAPPPPPMPSYFYQNSFPTSAAAAAAVAAAVTVSGSPYVTATTGSAPHFIYHQQSASSPEGN